MESYILYFWLAAGAVMIFLEFSGVSGVGLFFAGLGAASVALLVAMGLILPLAYDMQFAWFFGLTAGWAIILWKPLQRMLKGPQDAKGYRNMLGEEAIVLVPLKKGVVGEVRWSGTIMHAKLAPDSSVEEIPAGATVIIADVQGATLMVRPK